MTKIMLIKSSLIWIDHIDLNWSHWFELITLNLNLSHWFELITLIWIDHNDLNWSHSHGMCIEPIHTEGKLLRKSTFGQFECKCKLQLDWIHLHDNFVSNHLVACEPMPYSFVCVKTQQRVNSISLPEHVYQ